MTTTDEQENTDGDNEDGERICDEVQRSIAEFKLNRLSLIRSLSERKDILDRIVMSGITDEESFNVARVACSVIASDLAFEEAMMKDKTGVFDIDDIDELIKSIDDEDFS